MHFLKKMVPFMAVFGAIGGADALTARPTVAGAAAARMPTMAALVTATSSGSSSSTTASTLLANAECIDAYTGCMKGADACGPNFEECTNKVLFHAKMPQCLGTLAQCASAGVNSLFGTSTISALANVASTNSYGEVTNYTYPTDGSVLGQLITGAAISNRYDTSTCVRRYTSCLKKDNVCGDDFELCTTNTEFRKQRVFCDSTLARCQADGLIELFGSASSTATPSASSRIGEMIAEGAALAAVNAVSTCYKVIDQCILGACAANPYKCYESATETSVKFVDAINNGGDISTLGNTSNGLINDMMLPGGGIKIAELVSTSSISSYIRNACQSTIGGNKYCYATFLGNGMMPTASQLNDEDNQAEIYAEAYSARMNAAMKAKIAELVNQFDTTAKSKCAETIKSCAMRTCGGGSGAACYASVFGTSGTSNGSINGEKTYDDIKTGCASVVNTDLYCKYAAENPNATGTYNYSYINGDAFDILFPKQEKKSDPIGVVAALNASLSTAYNASAIAQMYKQCQAVATGCVRSVCGADYSSCYRRRTDVYSNLYNASGNGINTDEFNKSMNKVSGVLDYTIVIGLCLETVKNSSVCEEHLAIEMQRQRAAEESKTSAWGSSTSVRGGWLSAGSGTQLSDGGNEVIQLYNDNGLELCKCKTTGEEVVCGTRDANGNPCNDKLTISYATYIQNSAAENLFQELLYDLEKEAQEMYDRALTREQNACEAGNNGGIMAKNDSGSTYMWVKLRNNKIPSYYTTNGLKLNDFTRSNDLYGSFCRVKVTMLSDDKKIQEMLNKGGYGTAYFAVGDTFVCGSWIPESDLDTIANEVGNAAVADKAAAQKRTRTWLTVLGTLGSTAGGVALGEGIRKGNILGGLTKLGNNNGKSNNNRKNAKQQCQSAVSEAQKEIANGTVTDTFRANITIADNNAKTLGVSDNIRQTASSAVNAYIVSVSGLSGDTICASQTGSGGCKDLAAAATNALSNLDWYCREASETDDGTSAGQSGMKNDWIITASTAVATAGLGGFVINRAVRDMQKSELTAEQKAAYQEWMNNVGRHISCYVGDAQFDYGDVASVTLD